MSRHTGARVYRDEPVETQRNTSGDKLKKSDGSAETSADTDGWSSDSWTSLFGATSSWNVEADAPTTTESVESAGTDEVVLDADYQRSSSGRK